jgi:demethylmenaquinone methyltransferase/2-methoxy-6-polyprenyl-1,4-benzoquinol methylase
MDILLCQLTKYKLLLLYSINPLYKFQYILGCNIKDKILQVHEGHKNARKFFNSKTASSYDSIVRLATFGQDYLWKNHILNILDKRENILDLACGTGILSSLLSKNNKRHVIGLDLALDYLKIAKRKRRHCLFINGNAETLPYRCDSFDTIISSYLAKYVDIGRLVEECWRILKHNGVIVFHDFTYPQNVIFRKLWNAYFVVLQIFGKFSASWTVVFRDLNNVIRNTKWVEEMMYVLQQVGFKSISCNFYTMRTTAIISAKKP